MTFKTYFRANLNKEITELVLPVTLQSSVQISEFDKTAKSKDGLSYDKLCVQRTGAFAAGWRWGATPCPSHPNKLCPTLQNK